MSSDQSYDVEKLLESEALSTLGPEQYEALLQQMEAKISELLLGPREKLFQALYRLDVNEERAEQILSGRLLSQKKMSKSRALAQLILDREIRKLKTRTES